MQALGDGPADKLTLMLKAMVAAAQQTIFTDRCAVPKRRDKPRSRPTVPLNRTPLLACRVSTED